MAALYWFWVDPALPMSLLSALLFALLADMADIMWYAASGEGISVCYLWMWILYGGWRRLEMKLYVLSTNEWQLLESPESSA